MADSDLVRVLRALTEAAARFEKAAAHHKRIEAERKALQEAITDAQLVLSVQQRKPLAELKSLKPPAEHPKVSESSGNGKTRRTPKGRSGRS
jgi:hypothetical protein